MGGGDWPSSRTDSSSSSSRPRTGAGISGGRVILVGGSPALREGPRAGGCWGCLNRGQYPSVCRPPSFWRCLGAHLSGSGCREGRQSWPHLGLLIGTSSLGTGTNACCGWGSVGLLDRKEGEAITLTFSSASRPLPVQVSPVTSQEGFPEHLHDAGPPEGWGDWPGGTKETNLRLGPGLGEALGSSHWTEVTTWKGVECSVTPHRVGFPALMPTAQERDHPSSQL